MKAIRTRHVGPTDTKPARISAATEGKRRMYSVHALDGWLASERVGDPGRDYGAARHSCAAHRLARELGWLDDCELVSGSLDNGDGAHVLVRKEKP